MRLKSIALATAGLLGTAGVAAAQSAYVVPSITIVHALPGRDLGSQFNPALPVDVLLNNSVCLTPANVTFGQVVGPISVAPGFYDVKIQLADVLQPCGGATALESQFTISEGQNFAIVAGENASGAPAALAFSLDFSPIGPGAGKIQVNHAAAAPTVDISLSNGAKITGIAQGAAGEALVTPFGSLTASVLPTGTSTVVAGPVGVAGPCNTCVTELFVAGSAAKNSLAIVRKEFPATN